MSRTRVGWLAVVAGGALVLAVQVGSPVAVPVYDGVVVEEPYRYLHPTGDQPGNPTSFSATPAIVGGRSPTIVAATMETPPQAQLIAREDAFAVPAGIDAIHVSITAVEAPTGPPGRSILGNVYRFAVTDTAGNAIPPRPCDKCLSLVLRAPEDAGAVGTLMRYASGQWVDVATTHAGFVAMYQANPTAIGDYAVVGTPAPVDDGIDLTLVLAGLGIALVFIAFVGLLILRARPPSAAPLPMAGSRRVPAKRRRPRPPSERTEE
jgi:hypothetical protein